MSRRKKLYKMAKKFVKNEELVKMLKTRQYTRSELREMKVTEYQLMELISLGYNVTQQYDAQSDDFVVYILEKGSFPMTFVKHTKGKPFKIAKMADLHIGCNEVDDEELITLLSYFWETGIRVITLSGDIVDGSGVYRGQIQNLRYPTIGKQADAAVAILSLFDFHYITCKGNHDESATKNAGADVIALIEQKMVNMGKKFTYLKSYVGYVIFDDVAIQLMHMDGGGSSMSETYGSQKLMNNLFKTSTRVAGSNVNEVRIFDKNIPIVNVVTGHYHILTKFVYKDVIVESPLSMQHTTDFVSRRGLASRTGARVSNMLVRDGKLFSEEGNVVFGRDVEDIYELLQTKPSALTSDAVFVDEDTSDDEALNIEIDEEKLNKAMKILFKEKFASNDELELTKEEIDYINKKFNYSISINQENFVVLDTQAEEDVVMLSPIPQKGIVSYLELSNLFVGSKYFDEKRFRKMLDEARANNVHHIHMGGNIVWGAPKRTNVSDTKFFSSEEQINELVRILSDYSDLHFWAINGPTERSWIEHNHEMMRCNPLLTVSQRLKEKGVKFTFINSAKCDFVMYGIVFRMINATNTMKSPYTRDYPIIIAQRELMAKTGNKIQIDDAYYDIGAIFYGNVPNTQESYYGSIYVTSTGGPTYDPRGESKMIQSNAEAAIVKAYVDNGEILMFDRQILMV